MTEEQVGERIARIRDGKGLSQTDLGKAVGLSRSGIDNIEKGKNLPTLENFIAIASRLGQSLDELVFGFQPDISDAKPPDPSIVAKAAAEAALKAYSDRVELSEDELRLVSVYRRLTPKAKRVLIQKASDYLKLDPVKGA